MIRSDSNSVFEAFIRFAISTGRYNDYRGLIGRALGRHVGCSISNGLRIIIDKPGEYIQNTLLTRGVFEPGITMVIRSLVKPGDLVFDVGANIGYVSILCAHLGGMVYAFEPVPRLALRIRQNALLNKFASIHVSEMAVSYKSSVENFYIAKRKDDGSHSLIPGVPAQKIEQIRVETISLDDYVGLRHLNIPDFIKIDVEGYEAYVLDGARNLLTSPVPPVFVIETGDRLSDQLLESAETVLNRFYVMGFKVFKIQDATPVLSEISPDQIDGRLANYLAIHANSNRLEKARQVGEW